MKIAWKLVDSNQYLATISFELSKSGKVLTVSGEVCRGKKPAKQSACRAAICTGMVRMPGDYVILSEVQELTSKSEVQPTVLGDPDTANGGTSSEHTTAKQPTVPGVSKSAKARSFLHQPRRYIRNVPKTVDIRTRAAKILESGIAANKRSLPAVETDSSDEDDSFPVIPENFFRFFYRPSSPRTVQAPLVTYLLQ